MKLTRTFLLFFLIINSKAHTKVIYLDSISNQKIKEVVVTGQIGSVDSDNTLQKITVISKEILNSSLFNNLTDVVKFSTNISVTNDNILGSSLSFQGISGQNVKILIDGIPIIGRVNGNIDLSHIRLNNVERIEIIEGPMSVNFGTDALAATINIISKSKFKEGISYEINSLYETVGRYNLDLNLSYRYKLHTLSTDIGRCYFDGWNEGEKITIIPVGEIADSNRNKKWKPKEQYFSKINYIYNNKNITLSSFYNSFQEKISNKGIPLSPYYESAFDDYYFTYRNDVGLIAKYLLNSSEINTIFSYNQYKRIKNTYFTNLTNLSSLLSENQSMQDTSKFYQITAKLNYNNLDYKKIKYKVGLDYHYQNAFGRRIIDNTKFQEDLALFSTIEYDMMENIKLGTGIRYIYNSQFKAPIIPSANILIKHKDIALRLSYGRGFRAPTLKEQFFEFIDINHNIVGNDSLLSENSNNYTASLVTKYDYKSMLLNFNISAFINNINNKIDLAESTINPGQYSYFNLSEFKSKGISTNITFSYRKLKFSLGSSFTSIIDTVNSEELNYWMDFNSSFNLKINEYCNFQLFNKFIGKKITYFFNDNDELSQYKMDPYHLIDIAINFNLVMINSNISIGIKNLMNIKNITSNISETGGPHSSGNSLLVGYGRSFYIGMNFKL
ncbi:MAG: hypothetical protein CMP51_05205 [Flavobacteriales bacterium]|nr:hypothetical protein [Flavobacteriales bacterium]